MAGLTDLDELFNDCTADKTVPCPTAPLTAKTLEEAYEALVRNLGQPWIDIHPPRRGDDD